MEAYRWHNVNKCPNGNFGDELNYWMWKKLIPELIESDDNGLLLGIGTVIGNPIGDEKKIAVLGAGAGYDQINGDAKDYNYYAVRGPQTAERLKLGKDKIGTDAAIFLFDFKKELKPVKSGILFIPHFQTNFFPWREACETLGIEFIDPTGDTEEILMKINSAKLVLTEAMHGAIVADTFRVPWLPIFTRISINRFKWLDWLESMKLHHVVPVYAYWKRFDIEYFRKLNVSSGILVKAVSYLIKGNLNKNKTYLSEESVFQSKLSFMKQKLEVLKADHKLGKYN